VPRLAFAVVVALLVTGVFGTIAVAIALVDRRGRLIDPMTRLWARLVLRACGVRVQVSGLDNAPAAPAIYAANHCSALDIPILFGYLPGRFKIVHKRSLRLLPVVGWYLLLTGHIAIDRRNAFRARRSLAEAARRIRSGVSVAVFPEGTRSRDGQVHLFKRGSFTLALHAGAPVVPISLVGVKTLVPRGLVSLRPGAVLVRIHPPLRTEGRDAAEAETLAEQVRAVVAGGLAERTA